MHGRIVAQGCWSFGGCAVLCEIRPCSETDLTTDFESVIPGSTPGGGTKERSEFCVGRGCFQRKTICDHKSGNGNRACYHGTRSGYGLVVERVLAKDEAGFRLPLSAPKGKFDGRRPKLHKNGPIEPFLCNFKVVLKWG